MISYLTRRIGLVGSLLVLAIGTRAGADPLYTVTPLTNRSAGSASGFLNDLGQVAGTYPSSAATYAGYLYDGATGNVTTFPAPASPTPPTQINPSETQISGLNNSGQMIGQQFPAGGSPTGFLDSNGQFSPLPGIPMAINDNGQVAGSAAYVNGQLTDMNPGVVSNGTAHAYIDTNGTVKDLGANVTVYALNDAGKATGSLETGARITMPGSGGPVTHVLYDDGQTVKDLGTLGGQIAYGYAINNRGDIVGQAQTSTGVFHAFLAQQAGKLIDLGTLPGDRNSSAEAINDKGQVVGYSGDSFLTAHAFLYQNGMMTDLNKLLSPNSGVTLNYPIAINDAGQILAVGGTTGDDWQRLYLLTPAGEPQPVPPSTLITPAPEPSTLLVFAMASIGWATRRYVQRRGAAKNPLRVRTPIAG